MKKIIFISLLFFSIHSFAQSYNNNAHIFNICNFGAKKATIVFDGVMTSGNATLTSATASFVVGDVGKVIVVKRAGTSGRDLITTISGFTNSTTVTLTASASTSVTIARVTFGIDCTTAVQNAINASNGLLGGKVYIPLGWYIINGALQTSVGGINMNSQLYIPFTANSNSTKDHIIIEGESAPELAPPGGLSGDQTAPIITSGCVLYSTLTSGAASAAVIGTGNNGTSNLNFLSVENLGIIVANSPGGIGPELGGIQFQKGGSLITNRVYVGIDTTAYFSTYPSNNIIGIETTNDGAQTFNNLQNTLVVGFRTGYKIGEHVSLNQAQAWVCFYAFMFKSGTHSLEAHRIGTYWCAYDIYVNASSGKCNFINLQFDAEWQNIGKWYDDVNTIKDSANVGKGNIFYEIVSAGVGVDNTKFSISGGTSMATYPYSTPMATVTAKPFTTGSVPYSNGTDLTQNNANFFWDNTKVGLGIGTATVTDPNGNCKLKIVGTAATDPLSISDGTATASMFINNADANTPIQFGSVTNHNFALFSNNTAPFVILTAAQNMTVGSASGTAATYRTTNTGSDILSKFTTITGASISTAGKQTFAFDNTNGFIFGAANGTREIARAAINITNLTNTAASETGDLAFYTKPSGGAIAEGMRLTTTANLLIGTTSDNGSKLQLNGSLSVAYVAKTGTYTATASDYVIDCTSGTFTVTLPTAVGITGRIYNIVNSGSGTITIGTTSSQTFVNINATPTTLTLGAVGAAAIVSYQCVSNGANWIVTGKVKNE